MVCFGVCQSECLNRRIETFVTRPEWGACQPGGSQQVGIDITDATPHQMMVFNKTEYLGIGAFGKAWQGLEQTQYFGPGVEVATRQLARDKRVYPDLIRLQGDRQRGITVSEMIDPDRGVDKHHAGSAWRRGMASRCG